jgi:hypothetical protein
MKETIKGVIIAVIGIIVLTSAQRFLMSYIAPKIPVKTAGSVFYLEYGNKQDMYYAVKKDDKIVALFLDKGDADNLATKIGGSVEVFTQGQ